MKKIDEIWKDIVDDRIKLKYEVSNMGRIKNKNTGKILKEINGGKGYVFVNLRSKENKPFKLLIHRLVLITFNPIENMENLQVHHINHIRNDNRLDNLEWATAKENMQKLSGIRKKSEKRFTIYQIEKVLNKYVDKELVDNIIKDIKKGIR